MTELEALRKRVDETHDLATHIDTGLQTLNGRLEERCATHMRELADLRMYTRGLSSRLWGGLIVTLGALVAAVVAWAKS